MPARGKLIVLEGIDGSGKRTQLDLLACALKERGVSLSRVSFPNYSGFFGRMVAQFLNGEFGALEAVNPHFSALLYAGDRLQWKAQCEADLAAGKIILADRYVASNLAHQGARVPPAQRDAFLSWLRKLEYEVYGLTAEDLVVYLRVPASEAQKLIAKKAPREYTRLRSDIQESDLAHLEAALEIYDVLAREKPWVQIDCFDGETHTLRSPEAIHARILAAVDEHVFAGARRKG